MQARRISLILLFLFLALTVYQSANTQKSYDVDQRVYESVLHGLKHGDNYYSAFQNALHNKELNGPGHGRNASSIRAFREPYLYYALHFFPAKTWRLLSLVACFILLWLGRSIALDIDPRGSILSVVLLGCWTAASSSYLYLHAELWGVAFAMIGMWFLHKGRDGAAVIFFVIASAVRELFLPLLFFGLLFSKKKRDFAIGLLVAAALYGLHYMWGAGHLVKHGYQPALGFRGISVQIFTKGLGASTTTLGRIVGLLGLSGFVVLWKQRKVLHESLIIFSFCLLMLVLDEAIGRQYWSLLYGPLLATYTAGIFSVFERAR
jgi:hypothetical protein